MKDAPATCSAGYLIHDTVAVAVAKSARVALVAACSEKPRLALAVSEREVADAVASAGFAINLGRALCELAHLARVASVAFALSCLLVTLAIARACATDWVGVGSACKLAASGAFEAGLALAHCNGEPVCGAAVWLVSTPLAVRTVEHTDKEIHLRLVCHNLPDALSVAAAQIHGTTATGLTARAFEASFANAPPFVTLAIALTGRKARFLRTILAIPAGGAPALAAVHAFNLASVKASAVALISVTIIEAACNVAGLQRKRGV